MLGTQGPASSAPSQPGWMSPPTFHEMRSMRITCVAKTWCPQDWEIVSGPAPPCYLPRLPPSWCWRKDRARGTPELQNPGNRDSPSRAPIEHPLCLSNRPVQLPAHHHQGLSPGPLVCSWRVGGTGPHSVTTAHHSYRSQLRQRTFPWKPGWVGNGTLTPLLPPSPCVRTGPEPCRRQVTTST